MLMANQKKNKQTADSKVSADQFDSTNGASPAKKRTSEDVSEGEDANAGERPVSQSKL